MELIRQLFDTLVHLSPASVNTLAHQVGPWLYAILFGIIFERPDWWQRRFCRETRCSSQLEPWLRLLDHQSTWACFACS